MGSCEPGQGRKSAAISSPPQVRWVSHRRPIASYVRFLRPRNVRGRPTARRGSTWSSPGDTAHRRSRNCSARSTSPRRCRTRFPRSGWATRICSPARGGGKDLRGANPGEGVELRAWPGRRALQPVRHLPEHQFRRRRRCPGDRRRQQPRHRRDPPVAAERQRAAEPVAIQDLHHRRSPHAHARGVQRPAEDARRAAGAREVHILHDGSDKNPRHDPLPLPALRFRRHFHPRDLRAAGADRQGRGGRGRARGPGGARPAGGRLDARQPIAAGATPRLRPRADHRGRRPRDAGDRRRREPGGDRSNTSPTATRPPRWPNWTPPWARASTSANSSNNSSAISAIA